MGYNLNILLLTNILIGTGRPGYKMHLRLNLPRDLSEDEDDDDEGNIASLTPHMEDGMYDDQLSFPYDVTCHVTVFDQTDDPDVLRHHQASVTWHRMSREERDSDTRGRPVPVLNLLSRNELVCGRFNSHDGTVVMLVQLSHLAPTNQLM